MAVFRNDFREDRVCPTAGYRMVPDGDTITVPDEDADNWAAGGWTRVDTAPAPQTSKTTTPAVAPAPPEGTTD